MPSANRCTQTGISVSCRSRPVLFKDHILPVHAFSSEGMHFYGWLIFNCFFFVKIPLWFLISFVNLEFVIPTVTLLAAVNSAAKPLYQYGFLNLRILFFLVSNMSQLECSHKSNSKSHPRLSWFFLSLNMSIDPLHQCPNVYYYIFLFVLTQKI